MNRVMVLVGIAAVLLSSRSSEAEMPNFGSRIADNQPTLIWHETLDAGWEESRRRGVPMVIFITSRRCHYCDAMKRDTWCDHEIRRRLADDFVAIRLTPDRNASVLNRIDVASYPMTLIGVPQGKIIDHRIGYQPPRLMLQLLSKVKRR